MPRGFNNYLSMEEMEEYVKVLEKSSSPPSTMRVGVKYCEEDDSKGATMATIAAVLFAWFLRNDQDGRNRLLIKSTQRRSRGPRGELSGFASLPSTSA